MLDILCMCSCFGLSIPCVPIFSFLKSVNWEGSRLIPRLNASRSGLVCVAGYEYKSSGKVLSKWHIKYSDTL